MSQAETHPDQGEVGTLTFEQHNGVIVIVKDGHWFARINLHFGLVLHGVRVTPAELREIANKLEEITTSAHEELPLRIQKPRV